MTNEDIEKIIKQHMSLQINLAGIRADFEEAARKSFVGLTDEEIALICGECAASAHRHDDISFSRAIEAKLKEKNA